MIYLLIFSITVFTLYTAYIMAKYGVQTSISESYYRLPDNRKWLFTIALWGFAIPIVIFSTHGLMFFGAAGICFVAVAPNFKGWTTERNVHFLSAILGITLSMIYMIVIGYWFIPLMYVISCALTPIFTKKIIWWIEVLAFNFIILGLIYKHYNFTL